MVIPIDAGAELESCTRMARRGLDCPRSRRPAFPEGEGRRPEIALFYLPAGRISYDFTPPA